MSNNSDYSKPFMNLFDLLPDVYQSDVNRAVFGNLFNRFLSKQETDRVAGYIGQGNPNAIVKRQIHEPTVHRQGYQLQPLLYSKIGTTEWMSSWYDILAEAERAGIDKERMAQWLNVLQFNWVPPIDLDKLIHYSDYYWYDPDKPNSKPQYITIRSRCTTAIANLNFIRRLISQFGSTIDITAVSKVNYAVPQYYVVGVGASTNVVVVQGDARGQLYDQQFFEIQYTAQNNGVYQVNGLLTYNPTFEQTTIPVVPGTLISDESGVGLVKAQRFDKLVVKGNYEQLFDPRFIFFIKNSPNGELNNKAWEVKSSQFDSSTNTTVITLTTEVTNGLSGGVISQEEKLQAVQSMYSCMCFGDTGWDSHSWDDNSTTQPLWEQQHDSYIALISHSTAPSAPGTQGELWWDTTSDKLYEYNSTSGWSIVWNDFSLVYDQSRGIALWDATIGCTNIGVVVPGAEQWASQNKWLHRSDVPNFTIAKQAQLPIIEYDWDLELNEWTQTTYKWKYRSDLYHVWDSVDSQPALIELIPFDLWTYGPGNTIVLNEKYGNQTDWFVPGQRVMGTTSDEIFVVQSSVYQAAGTELPYRTIVTTNATPAVLPAGTPLRPLETSRGQPWRDHGIHWLFDGINETVAINHQPVNPLVAISPTATSVFDPTGNYRYTQSYYAQRYEIIATSVDTLTLSSTLLPGSSFSLQRRAVAGNNDIRVYVNNIRQYGTYDEISETEVDGTEYVIGVQFLLGYHPRRNDVVVVEVGEAAFSDIGYHSVSVRTIASDEQYLISGPQKISLIQYRKNEQVKTDANQYPLFDIYNVDGTPAKIASPIFGYYTTPEAEVNTNVGLRVTYKDDDKLNPMFKQFLLKDDGVSYLAYRDYGNRTTSVWVDQVNANVYFWDGFSWSKNTYVGSEYIPAIVSNQQPTGVNNGVYWYNPDTKFLRQYDTSLPAHLRWVNVIYTAGGEDPTLQTIWRHGLNDERYIATKRDWNRRSLAEYNTEKEGYIETITPTVQAENPTLPPAEVYDEAENRWYQSQRNHLSTNGQWVGDWEIPDPLFFNNQHENRQILAYRELLTHFDSIIKAQPKIPGFTGPLESMFHLIPFNEVNYGLGGKIKEFNGGFDNFLSSLFINELTPNTLIDFAHDQYEMLINNLNETYRVHAVELLSDVSSDSLVDQSKFIVDTVITRHELNDAFNKLYYDSPTFVDNKGVNDTGIRSWIATLPYVGLMDWYRPSKTTTSNFNQVIHHDGHRWDYSLTSPVKEGIVRELISLPDDRTRYPGPQDPPIDTMGRISTSTPPDNVTEFENSFSTTINNRSGVYWYYTSTTERTLYRLTFAAIGTSPPGSLVPDGTLWLDMTPTKEVLRVKITDEYTGQVRWTIPEGLSIGQSPIRLHNGTDPNDIATARVSAWKRINLDAYLSDIIFESESRLYENAPDKFIPEYDFEQLEQQDPQLFNQYMEQAFLSHVNTSEITTPYANLYYGSADPYTWNYRYSTPGIQFEITQADPWTNSFVVAGNAANSFDPCQTTTPPSACSTTGYSVSFYVKNSGVNDGTWTTRPSTFANPCAETFTQGSEVFTRIFVNEPVSESIIGVIYKGELPGSRNTGGESGGYWKDLYQKIYGTPYPHLEPWILQGYKDKPTWWDEEYLNTDSLKWGNRRWKYKHGFDVIGSEPTTNQFFIDGDFREVFRPGLAFTIDRSPAVHNGNWRVGTFSNILNVVPGLPGEGRIEVAGDQRSSFYPGMKFSATTAPVGSVVGTLKGLFEVVRADFIGPPSNLTSILVKEPIDSSVGFDVIGGTMYDPTTNLTSILIDTVTPGYFHAISSNVPSGRIVKAYGMWENIRTGVTPSGRFRPEIVPTWKYFSVNIDNHVISVGGTFYPDNVFPPYWNYPLYFATTMVAPFDRPIRSIFAFFGAEIVAPSADYQFGDRGPVEWQWRNSSQYLYDKLTTALRLDPVYFFNSAFGTEFYHIGGLEIDKRTQQPQSHTRIIFHGDVVNDKLITFNGLNQWYVNFARYYGLDLSSSNFKPMWTQWTAPMSYQFASFIDTPSLEVGHKQICISEYDYGIVAKKSPGVEDHWLDSFNIVTLYAPPNLARYDNQNDWRFTIYSLPPLGREMKYYDVHNYQFYPDITTDICTLYTWDIVAVNIFDDAFSVAGNQVSLFANGRTLTVDGSSTNDGTYTVVGASYNAVTNRTIVEVEENVSGLQHDGRLTLNYRSLPWNTGDQVVISTYETTPIPLKGQDPENGYTMYYVIKVSENQFRLALTRDDALANRYIDIQTTGRQDQYVGKLKSTFTLTGNVRIKNVWTHYEVDTTNVLTLVLPQEVQGIQTVIDFIDGYAKYKEDEGWVINADKSLTDPDDTYRFVDWQLELERFIHFIYGVRNQRMKVNDRYEVELDGNALEYTGESDIPLLTGEPVVLYSSNLTYPDPLVHGLTYYLIRNSATKFHLAATSRDAEMGIPIPLTSVPGIGKLMLSPAQQINYRVRLPVFEVNPFRFAAWFKPKYGVVSNLLTGPTDEVYGQILITDQFGRRINRDALGFFREDKLTAIRMAFGVPNELSIGRLLNDPYDFIHIGLVHLFIDTYEHVMLFENYTTESQLIYDPFLGLNTTKFEMLFNRQTEFTQRPNVGGQYLQTYYNQGADLRRNWEASVEDLRNLYDTFQVSETNKLIEGSRQSLGYEGTTSYLDSLNLNTKSQFLFWRGMIQHKGSVNAIKAFVNSRRFIDAKIDEFWAFKIAEYGSAKEKEFIDMYVNTDDAKSSDWRIDFIGPDDMCYPGYAVNVYDAERCGYSYPNSGDPVPGATEGFTPVGIFDEGRWYEYPDQVKKLVNNGGMLYFDLKPVYRLLVNLDRTTEPEDKSFGWIRFNDAGQTEFVQWNPELQRWDSHGVWDVEDQTVLLRHNFACDMLTLMVRMYPHGERYVVDVPVPGGSPVEEVKSVSILPYIPLSNGIEVFVDGEPLVVNQDYSESIISGQLTSSTLFFTNDVAGKRVEVVYRASTLVENVHYEIVTTNIVRLLYTEIVDLNMNSFSMWGWIVDKEAQNPAKLIDTKAQAVITPIQIWDPARGFHYYNSMHVIDLYNDTDPATYNFSPRPLYEQAPKATDEYNQTYVQPWGANEVGTTWLDTSNIDYVPYYDPYVMTNTEDRFRQWGQLADWSYIGLYTWVESDVSPDLWDASAALQEGNIALPESVRKTGRTRKLLFERDTEGNWVVLKNRYQDFDICMTGTLIENTATLSIDPAIIPPMVADVQSSSYANKTFTLTGDYTALILINMMFVVYGSTGTSITNDGVYTCTEISYDADTNITTITTEEQIKVTYGPTGQLAFYRPVDVYVNGKLAAIQQNIIPGVDNVSPASLAVIYVKYTDRVRVVRPLPADTTFIDSQITAGNMIIGTESTVKFVYDELGQLQTKYYFWVEQKSTRWGRPLSPMEAMYGLLNPPIPYMFFNRPKPEVSVEYDGFNWDLPPRFTQAIIRGIRGIVNDDNRYIVRWTRDFTLRDDLKFGDTPLQLKDLHEQWELLRKEQPTHIPRRLWDKVTECIVGYTLNDTSVRVPSYQRQLYDEQNETDTRFGLDTGQAFTDGTYALSTILTYLNDPNNNFHPVDINVFFEDYSFDTPEGIVEAMNVIYTTFSYAHVNRMFFDVLHDAFTFKRKYSDIFKTSYVALHGIKPFQVLGLFDD